MKHPSNSNLEVVRAAYDIEATNQGYLDRLNGLWAELGDTPVKAVRKLLKPFAGPASSNIKPILDLGCGTGRDLAWFKENLGFPVEASGCEISPRMRAIACANGFNVCDLDMHSFLKSQISCSSGQPPILIWCNFAIIHESFEALERLLTLVSQQLSPSGCFGLGFKAGDGRHLLDPAEETNTVGRPTTYFRQADVERGLQAAGLVVKASVVLPTSNIPIPHNYCWLISSKPKNN